MKKKLLLALLAFTFMVPVSSFADEGLWLPFLIGEQKYREMKKLGMKLTKEQLYDINQACIKDAVLGIMSEGSNLKSYGTGSFISKDGLLLTNYHVVMSFIEKFSSKENDFLQYGYWASKPEEETYCRGLEIKQLIRMEDVTEKILEGTEGLEGQERQNKINENGVALAKEAKKGTPYDVRMQAVFGDNQYIMNVYVVYRDVRMVAAPPFSVARFGVDIDNYQWPRHCADFAILRVYVKEGNKPARYSEKNVPFRPKHYYPISSAGVEEGDFVLVPGFPGTTRKYIPSFALDRIIYGERLEGLKIRAEKMNIIKAAVEENPELKYRYTTRLSSVANTYLRWKGEYSGVNRMKLVDIKAAEEAEFKEWVKADAGRTARYGGVLEEMETLYKDVARYNLASMYFQEAGLNGAELVPYIGKFEKIVAIYKRKTLNEKAADKEAERLEGLTHQFFNNWDSEIDRKILRNLIFMYYQNVPVYFHSEAMDKYIAEYNGDVDRLTAEIFASSMFTSKERVLDFLSLPAAERNISEKITSDPLYQIAIGFYQVNVDKIMRQRSQLQAKQTRLYGKYLEGYLEMHEGEALYPDANGSLRYAYGTVKGAGIQDGMRYVPFTTLAGVIDKNRSNPDVDEFRMPKKIYDLYMEGYNPYVCFMTDAHTTAGNSGSPVLNARGELVGLNFDRVWQGVASDYRYDPALSRNIVLDARYILFLLEHYAPNQYVLNQIDVE